MLFVAALILIPEHYLAGELEHEVSWVNYLDLTWLATSMGIMAGAVGSSFDDDEAIRDATYSLRESERRSQFKQEQAEADEQGNEPPPVDEVDQHGRTLGTAGSADGESAGHLSVPGDEQQSSTRS